METEFEVTESETERFLRIYLKLNKGWNAHIVEVYLSYNSFEG